MYTSFKEGGYKGVISAGLDFIPIVGNAKALVEAAIGRDPITGRKLESWERGASAAAILGGPLVKGVKHGAKLGAKAISGATSSSKAKNKTVNLAKSPTPTNPPKQQTPSSPAKSKEQGKSTGNNSNGNERTKGETNSTKIGKEIHKQRAGERRNSGEYDLVNEALKDKDGSIIEVPKRINSKTGIPSRKTQRAIPDAVQGPPRGRIIDDKPVGRPISKDKQEIRRFIEAYTKKYGEPPKEIVIERYDPKTGASAGKDIFDPNDFRIP